MPEKKPNLPIKSPCTNVCTLDFDTGYCYGCGRDRSEIAQWGEFNDDEREKVMAILPERMQAIEDSI